MLFYHVSSVENMLHRFAKKKKKKICSTALAGMSQGLSSSLPNENDGSIIDALHFSPALQTLGDEMRSNS
jgi:hypothetical protein